MAAQRLNAAKATETRQIALLLMDLTGQASHQIPLQKVLQKAREIWRKAFAHHVRRRLVPRRDVGAPCPSRGRKVRTEKADCQAKRPTEKAFLKRLREDIAPRPPPSGPALPAPPTGPIRAAA